MDSTIGVLARYGYLVVFGSILAEQIQPSAMKAPAQKRPPSALKTTNRPSGIRTMPARGGAIVLKPGMNLATIKERGPCLEKIVPVRLTHESGSSEMRQSQPSTFAPPSRPMTYQAMSAMSEAIPDRSRSCAKLSLPVPANAPAARRNGIAGNGRPIFARQLEIVADYAVRLGSWTLVLIGAALGGYITWKFISRQRFLRRIRMARISPEELKAKLDGGEQILIVDVRDRIDFEAEPTIIPGALHLTIEDLDQRYQEIPREREIVLYCT